MYKSQIRIELLSDLCAADGNGYNSSVDVDVCHDDCGLPYIPAKRLKGCLRECAQELNDWGGDIPIESLFGEEGDKRGACSIRNAYLEKRGDYEKEIMEGKAYALCHPQNVLQNFTYIRNQTAMDYVSGTAKKQSLRAMRVVKKGLVFVADVEWEDMESLNHNRVYLQDCCAVLKHIGVSRTRGFGNVRVSMEDRKPIDAKSQISYVEGATCLRYEITLKEPIVCKSVSGQEQNSMDYIEGAKILGLIAGRINRSGQDFVGFMDEGDGSLKCSNAYLQKERMRLTEVPACFYGIKNNASDYCDKIYEKDRKESEDRDKQLNPMKHCYVQIGQDGALKKYSVAMEERYHHRRPADKSIGRANEGDESVFYQMSSICAGQKFQGFITGSRQQIKQIYDMFSSENEIQLGYGKTTEYGRCEIRILSMDVSMNEPIRGSEFWMELISPAVLYNENAFYTTDMNDLKEEIGAALGVKESDIADMRYYGNFVTIGGYNVTWQMRKPTIEAFDKGTVVHMMLKSEMEIPFQTAWIGERNAEGYGEIQIYPVKENGGYLQEGKIVGSRKETEQQALSLENKPFLTEIAENLFQGYLACQAASDVQRDEDLLNKLSESTKPTVQNMILMCQDAKTMDEMQSAVSSRYDKASDHKQKKGKVADEILKSVRGKAKTLEEEFRKQQNLEGFSYRGNVEMEYLRHYLIQMKYKLRENSRKGDSEQEGEVV